MSGYEAARRDTRRRASELVDRVLGRGGGGGVGGSGGGSSRGGVSGVRQGSGAVPTARGGVRSGGKRVNNAGYGAPPMSNSGTRTVRNVLKSKRRAANNIELEHGWQNPGLEIGFGRDKYKKPRGTIPGGSAAASPQDRVLQKKRGKANVVGQCKCREKRGKARGNRSAKRHSQRYRSPACSQRCCYTRDPSPRYCTRASSSEAHRARPRRNQAHQRLPRV